jgi:hypothetical protein
MTFERACALQREGGDQAAGPNQRDRGESNSPPPVRLRPSLFVIVGVFYTFTLEAVVSVRLRSPALVSKQVSNPHIAPLVIPQACCRCRGRSQPPPGVISDHQTGFRLARSAPNSWALTASPPTPPIALALCSVVLV